MKLLVGALVLVGLAMGISACETVKGVGKDIQKGGEALDRTF